MVKLGQQKDYMAQEKYGCKGTLKIADLVYLGCEEREEDETSLRQKC